MEEYYVLTYSTENTLELMEQLFELKLQSENRLNKFKKYLKIHSANQC